LCTWIARIGCWKAVYGGSFADAVPEVDREGLILQANHLFNDDGYFDKDKWPREARDQILKQLAGLPAEFGLPIVFGHLKRITDRDRQHAADIAEHIVAFARAELVIKRQMHRYPRDEVSLLIAEDTDQVKKSLKQAHAFLRDPDQIRGSEFGKLPALPRRKIIDTPHFAGKSESLPLQIANVCAFLIMCRLMRRDETQPFFEVMAPQLVWSAVEFGERMGSERIGGGQLF
jgi:hypothetical protein